jgi:hypothetical protein
MSMEFTMFNNLSSRQSSESAPESTYIEVAGLMDDFMSLEELAPGSDYNDLLAASWGLPCTTKTPEARPSLNLKAGAVKLVRSLFQASRSKLETA